MKEREIEKERNFVYMFIINPKLIRTQEIDHDQYCVILKAHWFETHTQKQ